MQNIVACLFQPAPQQGSDASQVISLLGAATRTPIADVSERWEHILFPLVLIGQGVVILVEGHAFGP